MSGAGDDGAATARPVLEVHDLHTHFHAREGVARAVNGVSLSLHRGEIVGLVGESGSGKSVFGFSLMGLVDEPGRVVGGSIRLGDHHLDGSDAAARPLRGKRIAMIFQDPMMTLNPVLRVDTQMIEAIQAHADVDRDAARTRARNALARVGIPSPDERLSGYPHQFSGGMRQRVAIAIALLNEPDVIVADEPTTALDVTIQAQIIHEVQALARDTGTALIWITHDLSVIGSMADRIAVMYAGRIVEEGPADDVLDRPMHHYTRGLIASIPSRTRRGQRLQQIDGMTPSLLRLPPGCPFHPRCPRAEAMCTGEPPIARRADHWARCHFPASAEAALANDAPAADTSDGARHGAAS